MQTPTMFLCQLMMCLQLYADIYEYPIALQADKLAWITQEPDKRLRLAFYDIHAQVYKAEQYTFNQELLHNYSIEQFTLLSDRQGYSFIDNGRLRVKYASKGSPESIDFIEPIHTPCNVFWISSDKGILSAKWHNRSGIFSFTIDGRTEPILWDGALDYLYAQVHNDKLFCIAYNKHSKCYTIMTGKMQQPHIFSLNWDQLSYDEQMAIILGKRQQPMQASSACGLEEVVTSTQPIVCLHMHSQYEGYYCAYEAADTLIHITYNQLIYVDTAYTSKALFSFSIAKPLVEDLVEHLTPFLPYVDTDTIYYCDSLQTQDTVGLFCYDKKTDSITQLISQPGQVYLGCLKHDGKLYYGAKH